MSTALRVVDITQCYSPTSGGIRTYLHAKATWAAGAGADHAAITTGPEDAEARLEGSRMIVVRGRTPTDRWGYRMALRPGGVLRALSDLRPHVVVVHDALAFPHSVAEWAADHGSTVLLACHSHLSAAVSGLPRAIRRPVGAGLGVIQRRAFRAGDVILVASRAVRDLIAGEVNQPLRVTPLGVDVEVFARATPDPELRSELAPAESALLLYAGRLSSEKRLDLLLDAFASIPGEPVLAMAGGGAARARLERRTRRLHIDERVRFLGHITDRREIASLMATADCFVHPNPDEPFGLAPVEAATAGCRVVAPWTIGSQEVLSRAGATLVMPGASDALARGVRDALDRPRPPRIAPADVGWARTFQAEWRLYEALRRR
ncbi:MAG: glycosyltransferase [Thermoleophilia bacterium]